MRSEEKGCVETGYRQSLRAPVKFTSALRSSSSVSQALWQQVLFKGTGLSLLLNFLHPQMLASLLSICYQGGFPIVTHNNVSGFFFLCSFLLRRQSAIPSMLQNSIFSLQSCFCLLTGKIFFFSSSVSQK